MSENRITEKYRNQAMDFARILANKMETNGLIIPEIENDKIKGTKSEALDKYSENELRNFSNDLNRFLVSLGSAYQSLQLQEKSTLNQHVNPSQMISALSRHQVYSAKWVKNQKAVKIIDKLGNVAGDIENLKYIREIFENANINIAVELSKLLEGFSRKKIMQYFKPGINTPNQKFDFVAEHPTFSDSNIYFEVKSMDIQKYQPQRDHIFQLYELLKSGEIQNAHTHAVLIMYTDAQSNEFESVKFKFSELVERLIDNDPSAPNRIHLIPSNTRNLVGIDDELRELHARISVYEAKRIDYRFFDQPVTQQHPTLDDHYFAHPLDLNKSNYEIIIEPISPIEHWRVGVKFSKDGNPIPRTIRHGVNAPLFHLEKNKDSQALKFSYYQGGQMVINKATEITNYTENPVHIKLSFYDGITTIDVLNDRRKTILDSPIKIPNYSHCELFAWGDRRNTFQINAAIMEFKKD